MCWTAWAKNRLSGACTYPSLSLPLSFCRVSADVVTRAPSPLGRYLYYLSASPPAVPPYYHLVLPFSHCYTASDLRPAETTRRT